MTKQLIEAKAAIRGIDVLTTAIKKLRTEETQLTTIHSDLCRLCLVAKCFKPALKFLDVDMTCVTHTDEQVIYVIYVIKELFERNVVAYSRT